jgi:hypothetical protein
VACRHTTAKPPLKRCNIFTVKKSKHIPSRRRAEGGLSRKVFAYFTAEEYEIVQRAAKAERRSLSSFVALVTLDAARTRLRKASS